MDEKIDRILDAGVGAVVTATGLALLGTLIAAVNDQSPVASDFARIAWVAWAFFITAWATVILLDYWIPVKDEPRVLVDSDETKVDGA